MHFRDAGLQFGQLLKVRAGDVEVAGGQGLLANRDRVVIMIRVYLSRRELWGKARDPGNAKALWAQKNPPRLEGVADLSRSSS